MHEYWHSFILELVGKSMVALQALLIAPNETNTQWLMRRTVIIALYGTRIENGNLHCRRIDGKLS